MKKKGDKKRNARICIVKPITSDKMKSLITKLQYNKFPGYDLINNKTLKINHTFS